MSTQVETPSPDATRPSADDVSSRDPDPGTRPTSTDDSTRNRSPITKLATAAAKHWRVVAIIWVVGITLTVALLALRERVLALDSARIKELIPGAINPKSGKPRTLIMVNAPGERLAAPVPKKGHRGTRYTEGEDWPA